MTKRIMKGYCMYYDEYYSSMPEDIYPYPAAGSELQPDDLQTDETMPDDLQADELQPDHLIWAIQKTGLIPRSMTRSSRMKTTRKMTRLLAIP